jgi:UDP-2,3-diacylglucosamine hydrolase
LNEKGKIYFVSDVHLGAPALSDNRKREQLFVSWLDNIRSDATEIYLMGDIFDYWFEYKKVVPRGFTRVLGKLAEITDRGIPVHYFTGNHDIWIFDYLPTETGVIVHHNPLTTSLLGKKFLLAHGDGLDPNDKGYLLLKKIFKNRTLQWLYARLHPNFAISLAQRWSKSSRLSKKPGNSEFAAEDESMYQYAKSVLEKEHYDYFVFGHRHQMANIALSPDSRFILLGDWIKTFSYGSFDGNTFDLKIFYKND